eukprot:135554-Pyramimonas_sp.AAC.1
MTARGIKLSKTSRLLGSQGQIVKYIHRALAQAGIHVCDRRLDFSSRRWSTVVAQPRLKKAVARAERVRRLVRANKQASKLSLTAGG